MINDLTSIHCQSWDIGTGVAGYVWHAHNARAALLLQHGFGEYAQRYVKRHAHFIPRLLEAGVSVYAFDMRGHGRSPGERMVTDIGQAVEDHLAARSRLRRQSLPVFVMGHSLGGLVAASSLVRSQTGVSGAILSSSILYADSIALIRLLANAVAAIAPAMRTDAIEKVGLARLVTAHDPMLYRFNPPMVVAASILTTTHNNLKRYCRWQVSTLVLHGTADRFTNPEDSVRFYDTITSGDRTLHLVEGGNHELLNDVAREETLQQVLTWLDDRLSHENEPSVLKEPQLFSCVSQDFSGVSEISTNV